MEETNKTNGLFAGASRMKLEYPDDFFPHTGFRGRYFTGIRDDLCVRSIAVSAGDETLLFITLELGDIGSEWIPQIAAAAGIKEENVFLGATHTHSAPHAGGFWKEDVVDVKQGEAFSELCRQTVLKSVYQAMEEMQPVRLRVGTTECQINVNRDFRYQGTDGSITVPYIQAPNPGGISDKTVYLMEFESLTGEMVACLFSYAVHSNVNFYQTWDQTGGMQITGDIAGVAMRYVESHVHGDAVAGFFLGAAADQSPKYLANHRIFDREGNASWEYYGQEAAYVLMDAQGTELGRAVVDGLYDLNEAKTGQIQSVRMLVDLESKLDGHKKKADETETANTYAAQYKEKMAQDFEYVRDKTLQMPVYLTRLFDVTIVAIPAEIVTSIGIDIRKAVTEKLGGFTVILTQCNGAYSYISDDWGYTQRTFEALASHFMPGTGERLVEGAAILAERVLDKPKR